MKNLVSTVCPILGNIPYPLHSSITQALSIRYPLHSSITQALSIPYPQHSSMMNAVVTEWITHGLPRIRLPLSHKKDTRLKWVKFEAWKSSSLNFSFRTWCNSFISCLVIYSSTIRASMRQSLSLGFPTKQDSHQSPQLQGLARKMKFRM